MKKTTTIIILIITSILTVYFFVHKKIKDIVPEEKIEENIISDTEHSSSTATSTLLAGVKGKEYKNTNGKFDLVYPESMEFKVYNEGNGSYTVLFEEKNSDKSFQIFFTPYNDNSITTSRLKMDIPSEDYTKPTEVVLANGTRALIFYSNGPAGELREVWFIKNGFLYEISTYKELDSWLGQIISTFKFI